MRSAIIAAAAALASGVMSVPLEKRAVVTQTSVVYVTQVVTVTAGASSSSRAAGSSSSVVQPKISTSTKAATTSTKAATTSSRPITTSKSVAPSSSKVASSSSAAAAAPTNYQQIAVYHHNLHRSNHSAPSLTWSSSLANTAAQIASSCVYAHNTTANGGGYGQNIAAGVQANNISYIITELFYNGEVNWYNGLYGEAQPSMDNFEHWGHFSQIVWKGTGSVGCATQDCSAHGLANVASDVAPYFTVCNYENPGNYANEYGSNIGSPLNQATAHWNTGLSS